MWRCWTIRNISDGLLNTSSASTFNRFKTFLVSSNWKASEWNVWSHKYCTDVKPWQFPMCTTDQKLFKAYTVFDLECFLFMDVVIVGNGGKCYKESSAETDPLWGNIVWANLNTPPTTLAPEFVPSLLTLLFRAFSLKAAFRASLDPFSAQKETIRRF